jgi:hypothetical protein
MYRGNSREQSSQQKEIMVYITTAFSLDVEKAFSLARWTLVQASLNRSPSRHLSSAHISPPRPNHPSPNLPCSVELSPPKSWYSTRQYPKPTAVPNLSQWHSTGQVPRLQSRSIRRRYHCLVHCQKCKRYSLPTPKSTQSYTKVVLYMENST